MSKPYDSVVLGSGIGGLTTAVLLAKQKGERVLLLEQHNIIGGFTHTFRRGHYEWDTGLHYVGNMGPQDFPRFVMNYLTAGKVEWLKMPEVFEHFVFPTFDFKQRVGETQFTQDLCAKFPHDQEAIQKYFRDLLSAQIWGTLNFASRILPPWLAWIPALLAWPRKRWGRLRLKDYLDQNISNKDLAALLTAPCGDYGLPPSQASFFVHALIVRHYVAGGFYPKGGSGQLPKMIGQHLRELGVEVRTRHRADEILTEKNRVTGVRVGENIFRCKKVYSAVGAKQTYGQLLRDPKSKTICQAIDQLPLGMGMATVYVGLKTSPARLGLGGENNWLFASTDFENMHHSQSLPGGEVQGCYISFPSLKDPTSNNHTAEIMVPARFETFAEVSTGGWRRRGARYEELKQTLAEKVLAFVEAQHPGFKDLVDYVEVSTPLSVQHFAAHAGGAVYGISATPQRYRLKGLGPRTHIKGLYLAGADVLAHGIVGAMMGGFCAFTASGRLSDVIKIFRALMPARPRSVEQSSSHAATARPSVF